MHDRTNLRVFRVDRPVFDGVHGDAAGLDVRRYAEEHDVPCPVEPRNQQDIAADDRHAALVNPAGAHPEAPGVFAHAEVPIRQPADAVQTLDVTEIPLVQQLVDRKRGREQVQGVQAFAGGAEFARESVAVPQSRLKVGVKLIIDHQLRGCQRMQPLIKVVEIILSGQIRNRIVPLLQRDKIRVHGLLRPHQVQAQVGQRPHQQGIRLAQDVVRPLTGHRDGEHKNCLGPATVRLRPLRVNEIHNQAEVLRLRIGGELVAAALEDRPQPLREARQDGIGVVADKGKDHRCNNIRR